MPRTPLRPIDANAQKKGHSSPYIRGQIIALSKLGHKQAQIARDLQIPRSTVHDTIRLDPQRDNGESLPRSGRPKTLSPADERYILILIKRDPFITYREIRDRTRFNVSDRTLARIIQQSGYGHWRAQKRPRLNAVLAKKRLEWALARKDWTYDEWSKVIWSDECSVELGKGKPAKWVFHLNTLGEKWKKEYIVPYTKSKGLSIMIWAAIWGRGHSRINMLNRDPRCERNGYSAGSYIEILENNLITIWEPGLEFMQDNAPIHTARLVKKWLGDHEIPVIDWPPYSPDLNPIEHAWAKLKELIYKLDPEIDSFQGTKDELHRRFSDLIERAWEELGQDLFDRLIQSMDNRINAVIEAKGWYTRC